MKRLLNEKVKNNMLTTFDLEKDDSLTKYVDPDIPFLALDYIPENLTKLESEFLVDTKGNATMRKEAFESLKKMAEDFYVERQERMVVVSTYRSYSYQAGIKARGCPDNLCAKAGHSEHQS